MAGQFLDDFKSRMTSFARANLFEVKINPRNNVIIPASLNRRLSFGCFSAQLPGMTTLTTEKDEGYRSIAYQKAYEDVSLGFYVHGDMKEVKIFQNWMKLMINPKNNHVGFYNDYVSTVEIKNLNQEQDVALCTTLHDAYPKSLSSMGLDYGSNDEVMKMEISFTYRHYTQVFGEVGKKIETTSRGNFTESSAEDIDATPVNELLKVGQGVRSGGTGLMDFTGAR